jgi:hypothetical protein
VKASCAALLLVATWSCFDARAAHAHAPQARNVATTADGVGIALALPGFGVLMRTRAEQPFAYLCDALLDHAPSDAVPAMAFLSDGSLLIGTSDGLRVVTRERCPATQAAGPLAGANVVAMAMHAATDTVYVATAGDAPALWRSVDGAQTWQKRSTLASAELISALQVDPGDPDKLYLSIGSSEQAELLVSSDGGKSFASFEQTRALTLLLVRDGRLWALARSADNTTNRGFDLLRAEAPAGPWSSLLRVNYFGGFAIDARGLIWVGDESGGLHSSHDGGDHFTDVAPSQAVACLAAAEGSLLACAPGTNTMPALIARDAAAFTPLVTFAEVDQLVDCAPDLDVPTRCAAAWVEWRRDVRMETLSTDAGADAAPPTRSPAHDGGCSIRGAGKEVARPGTGWLSLLVLGFGARERRRRAPRARIDETA